MAKLNGIPGDPEVWMDKQSGKAYIVYFVPDTEPPIPLLYLATEKELQAAFGPGKKVVYDKTFENTAALKKTGPLEWGTRAELANDTEDPFEAWASAVNDQAAVRPWLRDNEVLALIVEGLVEGREITAAEFEQTSWWRDHSDAQRQWMLLWESDPATAKNRLADQEILVGNMLREAGMSNPDRTLIQTIARNYMTGTWTQTYTTQQIKAITDPYSKVPVDAALKRWSSGADTTSAGEEQVRQMVSQWLGPSFGAWSDSKVAAWAGRLRNDPDAEGQLVEMLRNQRMALFPEYTDPNLTYDDIADPWRNVWEQTLGEMADETNKLFTQIVRGNDVELAGQKLRKHGMATGNRKVIADFTDGLMGTAIGQQVVSVR